MEGVKKRGESSRARKREEGKVTPRSKSKIPISTSRATLLKSERGSLKSASVISMNKIHTDAQPKKLVDVPDNSSKLIMVDVSSDLAVTALLDPAVTVPNDPAVNVLTDPAITVPTDIAVTVPSDAPVAVLTDAAEASTTDLSVTMPTEFALNVLTEVPIDLDLNSLMNPRIRDKISNVTSNLQPIIEQDDSEDLSIKSESSLRRYNLSDDNKEGPARKASSTFLLSTADIVIPPNSARATQTQTEMQLELTPEYSKKKAPSLSRANSSVSDLNKETVVQVCRCPDPANSTVILYDDKSEVESEPGLKETDLSKAYPKDVMVISILGSMCGVLLISLFLYILFGPSLLKLLKREEPGLIKTVIDYVGCGFMHVVATFMNAFRF